LRVVVLGLVPHPGTPCRAVERIEVRVERMPGARLKLSYEIRARPGSLRIPPPRPPAFADRLWHHTCCEAFIGAAAGSGYEEFNFSPSGEFAAYRFERYRAGISRLEARIETAWVPGRLEATIPVSDGAASVALCAVVEAADGALSYWALRHAPGKPDFHHPDAFALRLDELRD
jgi:hypothetical protein